MGASDKQFYVAFTGVVVILVLITIVVAIIANMASSKGGEIVRSEVQTTKLKSRIGPVGRVSLASDPVSDSAEVKSDQTAASGSDASQAQSANVGETAYNSICQTCHTTGLLDSPIFGDKASWGDRLAAGKETLYNSAINGKGLMAPKGGNTALSDDEVRAAVDYMLDSLN